MAEGVNVLRSTGSLNVTVAWDALITIVPDGLNEVAWGPAVRIVEVVVAWIAWPVVGWKLTLAV